MNKLTFFLIGLSLMLISCVPDKSKSSDKGTIDIDTAIHKNPVAQDQKDENALLYYAKDKNLNIKKTASGMYYVVQEMGTGITLADGAPFKVHYSGYFLDGKVFDSSHDRGVPLRHVVGGMIPGWNEALKTFPIGSKLQLLIPSRLAYGSRGFPGFVPANTPLIFDMHIMPLTE